MLTDKKNIMWFSLLHTVLISCAVAREISEERILNLRIGFDLTQGDNGTTALKIRDFEDGHVLRSDDKDAKEEAPSPSPAIRADSASGSGEGALSQENRAEHDDSLSKDNAKSSESAGASDDSDDGRGRQRSTIGIRIDEADDNPSIHGRYGGDDRSDEKDGGMLKILTDYFKKIVT